MLFILIYKFLTLATCSKLGQSENLLQLGIQRKKDNMGGFGCSFLRDK